MTEKNTAETELPYGDTPNSLRLDIARAAQRAQQVFETTHDGPLTDDEKKLGHAAMLASGYGWSIVALLGWLKRKHGEDVMWSAAAIVQDMFTNGDSGWCDDLPQELNDEQASRD